MCARGQGHSLAFVQGQSDFDSFTNSLLRLLCQLKTIFHIEPPWVKETNAPSNVHGTMTKMSVMPINEETPLKVFRS